MSIVIAGCNCFYLLSGALPLIYLSVSNCPCKVGVIIIIMSFMQGIYIYIPETNPVPREYSVAAIL
jgi:hypothetical protein